VPMEELRPGVGFCLGLCLLRRPRKTDTNGWRGYYPGPAGKSQPGGECHFGLAPIKGTWVELRRATTTRARQRCYPRATPATDRTNTNTRKACGTALTCILVS
jgi:hypothetical protein